MMSKKRSDLIYNVNIPVCCWLIIAALWYKSMFLLKFQNRADKELLASTNLQHVCLFSNQFWTTNIGNQN